jgi:dynein heavy chain, axonemal
LCVSFDVQAETTAGALASTFPGGSLNTSKRISGLSPGKTVKSLSSSRTTSSTSDLKDKDSFREALVHIINQQEEKFTGVVDGQPLELTAQPIQTGGVGEKDVLRYYYYINNGIDTEHIEAIDESWEANIMAFVSDSLKEGRGATIENLWDEVKDDYLTSIKKAIVDFVLKDDKKEDKKELSDIETKPVKSYTDDLKVVPKPWAGTFAAATQSMRDQLHLNNHLVQFVLNLWSEAQAGIESIAGHRLIRTKEIEAATDAFELPAFEKLVETHAQDCVAVLKKEWIATAVNELNQRKRLLPRSDLPGFFDCVATVMESQLRTFLVDSLEDYNGLFKDELGGENARGVNLKGFVIRLVPKDNELVFEPDFPQFKKSLLKVVDNMVASVNSLPRCETKLDFVPQGKDEYLKPVVWQSQIDPVREQVNKVLDEQQLGPEGVAQEYKEQFMSLIDRSADSDVSEFLLEEDGHSFAEYVEKISSLQELIDAISFSRPREIRVGMYYVSCRKVNEDLKKRAKNLVDKLIKRMKEDGAKDIKELSAKFGVIADKALETPTSTDHLMELQKYVAKAREKEVPVLTAAVEQSRKRLEFLLGQPQVPMTSSEMTANADLFTWLGRLDPIFVQHQDLIKSARTKAEDTLKTH